MEFLQLLRDYVHRYGRAPRPIEIHDHFEIGRWYAECKKEIKRGTKPYLYSQLAEIHPVLQEDLNAYLSNKLHFLKQFVKINKRLPKTWEFFRGVPIGQWYLRHKIIAVYNPNGQWLYFLNSAHPLVEKDLRVIFIMALKKFIQEYKVVPMPHEFFHNVAVGQWFANEKFILSHKLDIDRYWQLSRIAPQIKRHLNGALPNIYKDNGRKMEKLIAKYKKNISLLKEFAELFQCVPSINEKYKNFSIGIWFASMKNSLHNKFSPELFQDLCETHPLVSQHLQFFLEDNMRLLLLYIRENNRVPAPHDSFYGHSIGRWYAECKKKISQGNRYWIKIFSLNNPLLDADLSI